MGLSKHGGFVKAPCPTPAMELQFQNLVQYTYGLKLSIAILRASLDKLAQGHAHTLSQIAHGLERRMVAGESST